MKQLDTRVIWFFFAQNVVGMLTGLVLLIIIMMYFGLDIENDPNVHLVLKWFIYLIPLELLLAFIWAKLTHHFYRYELRDDGFAKEYGILRKHYVLIPYERIQNVDVYRSLTARIFGLSNLMVQTAGAGGAISSEGRLPGLAKKEAMRLRDELVQRSKQHRNQSGL